ncbi:penicillin-binding protein 2 [Romeria aff. gracilis LEGE 07310]|uniref:Penicillin-binding protein 2 n=1 Tax=Vasconcelosia minhoensis LEGE 07310 TaxID=915328 RepID=A0A8J7DMT2_9CYAN|nr:penicillin-binding protein 2 [Romeria gracilis]MBE9079311.1 penicillin-binding protein 2 [Romeria aff. gracilis LEGE 07310]
MAFLQQSSLRAGKNRDKTTGRTVGQQYQAVVLLLLSLVTLGGIGSRLAYLQLVQGDRNRQLAENNRILLLPRRPARGTIFDRNGQILAGSRLSHSVSIWPISLPEDRREAVVGRLAQILDVPAEEIHQRLAQGGYSSNESIPISRGISSAQATAIAEYASELPGVRIEAEAVRDYPHGDLAAHVLGYTGEMDDEELAGRQAQGYRLGDVIGKLGVEAAYESRLRGEWGGQQVEVDSGGRVIGILGEKPPQSGQDIRLTLDLKLQRSAEAALGDQTGAIVALDPRDGAILAMVSRPTFDPNIFSTRISEEQWASFQSRGNPFVNRAMRSYPPASTFKIVTATAGIESGKFSPEVYLPTYPYLSFGGIQFWDWNNAGFGTIGFRTALAMSSDTFFYQVGRAVGGETLAHWMRQYGFGQKTGIELAAEEDSGTVPDEAWKQAEIGEGWYLGDTINTSIGQGFVQTTPLQVAVMFAVPANGGYRVTPHLLLDQEAERDWKESLDLAPSTLQVLREGLRQVVSSGTGKVLKDPDLPPISGKSGTAEAPPYQSHTWFGAYGPSDNPEIVVVAFGEHSGGGGGSFAAPMVKQVLEAYFKADQPKSGS